MTKENIMFIVAFMIGWTIVEAVRHFLMKYKIKIEQRD